MTKDIPRELLARPFTSAEAEAHGVTATMLRGRRFVRLHRGVYAVAELDLTHSHRLAAACLHLPADAVVSHLSAARLWGFDVSRRPELQFSTNRATRAFADGVVLHRRRGMLHPIRREGFAVTGPDRTFVDCATQLSLVELVQLGDFLLHTEATTIDELRRYASDRHLDGVQRARIAATEVTGRSESPMESLLRMILTLSGLPRFEPNQWIRDQRGQSIARADLLNEEHRVIAEYDGIHHERDPRQRQRDHERREALDGLGYRVVVFTAKDLSNIKGIAWRVHQALAERNYRGARPEFGHRWAEWFRHPQHVDSSRSFSPPKPTV